MPHLPSARRRRGLPTSHSNKQKQQPNQRQHLRPIEEVINPRPVCHRAVSSSLGSTRPSTIGLPRVRQSNEEDIREVAELMRQSTGMREKANRQGIEGKLYDKCIELYQDYLLEGIGELEDDLEVELAAIRAQRGSDIISREGEGGIFNPRLLKPETSCIN